MNALANEKVGDYLNAHFVSASQKVGTFQVIGKAKVGGNVASYFCRVVNDELHVIHCIPGPVDAPAFLAEARFAVELHNQAMLVGAKSWQKYGVTVQNGFRDRTGVGPVRTDLRGVRPAPRDFTPGLQGQVNDFLAKTTLPKLAAFYPHVWEKILREPLSAAPVVVR